MTTRALVIGLGATGLSLARHLSGQGFEIVVADTRAAPPKRADLAKLVPSARLIKLSDYAAAGSHAAEVDLVALSPGVPPGRLALPSSGFEIIGDLEIFLRSWRRRWTGVRGRPTLSLISGTNGKSTCAMLAAGLLRAGGETATAVGNIGIPLLDALAEWESGVWPDHVIAELSSFQLATAGAPNADIACLLNIGCDHLDWHGSAEAYRAAKVAIFAGASRGVFARDDDGCRRGVVAAQARLGFSLHSERCAPGEWTVQAGQLTRAGSCTPSGIEIAKLLDDGIMATSACAALAVADAAGRAPVQKAQLDWLANASGLPHRLAKVCERAGIAYFDDSKATNAAAAAAALNALGSVGTVLIAGGESKGQSFGELAAVSEGLSGAVLFGRAREQLRGVLQPAGIAIRLADSMPEAVTEAARLTCTAGAQRVLLSPGCSSLDMFIDYRARGAAFCAAVRELPEDNFRGP